MLPAYHQNERGQILIIITVALIGLLGMTSLAIDGGMIYSDRRQAQNAADAAALAGALKKSNGGTDAAAIQAAREVIIANHYDPAQVNVQVSNSSDLFGTYHQVRADLEVYTQTSLMHLFGRPLVTNEVMAIAKTRAAGPAMPGMAIIAMGDCTAAGGPRNLVSIDGGGNSGEVLTYRGGIFLNSPDPSGNPCAIDPPSSAGSQGVKVHDGHTISSVGQHTYAGEAKVIPSPINVNVNSGVRIGDPLEGLEEPRCTANGSRSGNVFSPGRFGGAGQPSLGSGTLNPGIYCITGDLDLSGQQSITGTGVVLYFINGGSRFTGQAVLNISAPNASNCLGTAGDPTASCTYQGIALFMARGNRSTFDVRGNGDHKIIGTVYALNGDVKARGGGRTPDEWMVNGQVIARSVAGDGNGSFTVTYNADNVFQRGPSLSLTK